MLDENVLVVDFDPDHWARLIRLFQKDKREGPKILFLIVHDDVCLKAIHSEKGAIRPFDYREGDLAAIREEENVDYVARVGRDFLQQAFAEGESEVHFDDDWVQQALDIFNRMIEFTRDRIEWHPERPRKFKQIQYEKIRKAFDKFFPDGRTMLFCVTENGRPYTSLIVGKRSGHITLLTTLEALGLAHEPMDPESDLPGLMDMLAERFDKVHQAFVIEKRCFEELVSGKRPLSFLKGAIAHRRACLHPYSLRLRLLLWAGRTFKGL